MDNRLAAHVHDVLHVLIAGLKKAPETEEAVTELFADFAERANPILREQLRVDLLTTPPDDRDAQWREYWATANKEEN